MFQASPEGNLLDETSCLGVEELVVGLGSESPAGRSEACDVVVGRGGLAVGHSGGSHCCCVYEGVDFTVGRWECIWRKKIAVSGCDGERCFEPSRMPSTGSRRIIEE